MMKRYTEKLNDRLSELLKDGVCIAFSGGVDSALLLKLASQLDGRLCAVTFTSTLQPGSDTKHAENLAKEYHVDHMVIELDPLQLPHVQGNTKHRCAHCKFFMFSSLRDYAKQNKLMHVIDGTNFDDLHEYRPGLASLEALGVISPLAELKMTKQDVRNAAASLGLSVATKPSSPCLATRLPYDQPITSDLLAKIEAGEEFLKKLGFETVRLRVHPQQDHSTIARLEVPKEKLLAVADQADKIQSQLKVFGFDFVTLDLAGFKSGGWDSLLNLTTVNDLAL